MKIDTELTVEEVNRKYGISVFDVGFEPFDYAIVGEELDTYDLVVNAHEGDLCIITLDEDKIDQYYNFWNNYLGTVQDDIVFCYRYYYFKAIE